MNKPLFSFVLIARNEAVSLPNLLKSIEDFKARGGNIVLVDTGSSDDTVKIAEDWGCRVDEVGPRFVHTIDDAKAAEINERFIYGGEKPIVKGGDSYFSFGEARAYAMSLAENDWVCCPGCDEVFLTLDIDKVNAEIEKGEFTQFRVDYIWKQNPDGTPAVRFFRDAYLFNRTRWKWVGDIHETVIGVEDGKDEPWTNMAKEIALAEHHQLPQSGRSNRDLVGLACECLARPDNDRNAHYFARQLYFAGRYLSAVQMFLRHIKMNSGDFERGQSMTFIGDCYKYMGDLGKALEWYNVSFMYCSARREPLMRMAEIFHAKNDYQRAAAYAAAALTIPHVAFYANQLAHYTYGPHEILYWALYWLGDKAGAKEHWMKALAYAPKNAKFIEEGKFFYDL